MANLRNKRGSSLLPQLKQHFNQLLQTDHSPHSLYRTPKEQDIKLIYSQQLIKKQSGQPLSICADLQEFKEYGPGIYLLFKFLRHLILIFAIMGLLSVVNISLLASGSHYQRTQGQSSTFAVSMAMLTVGNIQDPYLELIPPFYLVQLMIFTGLMVYWKWKQGYQVVECCEVRPLTSYFTAKLNPIPQGFSQSQLKQFLEDNFGQVEQIFSVKQFNDDLFHYKQISEIIHEYKIQRCKIEASKGLRQCNQLISLFNQFFHYYLKVNQGKKPRYQPVFAFIRFKEVRDREQVLTLYDQSNCCSQAELDQKYLFKGQRLQFERCNVEPNAISWENISLPAKHTCLRMTLQIILITLVFFVSLFIIYILALAQNNITTINHEITTLQQALATGNEDTLTYYCLGLSVSSFLQETQCSQYQGLFVKVILLGLLLPLLISLLKFLFVELMKHLVLVRRHSTQIEKLQSQIVITFIFYFAVLGILQLIIDLEITTPGSGISINRLFHSIASDVYSLLPVASAVPQTDFSRQWFLNNTDKIMLVAILSFNFSSLIDIIYSVLRKAYISRQAAKQQTVAQMNDYLKCQTIQIQFIYAFALNIIFFTLLFGPVMPLLWILGFPSVLLLYFIQKLIFVRYCQHPTIYGHSLNHLVTRIILFGVVLSTVTTPLLLGAVIQPQSTVSDRYIQFIYYPIFGALVLIGMFFKKYWLPLWQKLKGYLQSSPSNIRLPTILSKIQRTKCPLSSYSMHSNPDYQPILKVIYTLNKQQQRRSTFIIHQQLSQYLSQAPDDDDSSPFGELLEMIRGHSTQNSSLWNGLHSTQIYKNILSVYSSTKRKRRGVRMSQESQQAPETPGVDQIIQHPRIQRSGEQDQGQGTDRFFSKSFQASGPTCKPKSAFFQLRPNQSLPSARSSQS